VHEAAETVEKGINRRFFSLSVKFPSFICQVFFFDFIAHQNIFIQKADFDLCQVGTMVERVGGKSIFILTGLGKAMAKYKSYDYAQRVMIPVYLEEQLVPGTLESAIQTLVEDRMDMEVFEDRYQNDETGRLAYDPKIFLKVVLLGYGRGLISSRKMEQACREKVTFMALTRGGGSWEYVERDGGEGGYGEGAGDLSSGDRDSGAGVCEYPGGEEDGSVYVAGENQGEHPVGAVLYGSQYWEDYELWVCLEGLKEDKYIKIG
jgi:hypothetical protein